MKFFHVGIRVDEIVSIFPNKGEDAKEYKTKYYLRNGSSVSTTGTWEENTAKVERMLTNLESDRERFTDASVQAQLLQGEIANLEIKKKALQEAVQEAVNSVFGPTPTDAQILAAWLIEGRPYMRIDEKEALRRSLSTKEEQ